MVSKRRSSPLERRLTSTRFQCYYRAFAFSILLVTTIVWSYLSAVLQQSNADQLVDAYLFENTQTFNGALFPDTHSFLIKWPIFLLLRLLNYSDAAFIAVTVAIAVITVGCLTYLAARIERRPLMQGTLFLAIASILLLVPAMPYAGALLPVNMAMTTTRNLEYLFYIAALLMILRAPRLKSWQSIAAGLLLGLLIASDKLFLSLIIGATLLYAALVWLRHKEQLLSLRKLLITVTIGIVLAIIITQLIARLGITNLVGSAVASPYGAVHGLSELISAIVFAAAGLLINFGANPAFDARTFAEIPVNVLRRATQAGGYGYIVNAGLFTAGLLTAFALVREYLRPLPKAKTKLKKVQYAHDVTAQLSLLLLASSLVSVALFIIADHYHPVDARYMGISLFAIIIASSTYLRSRNFLAQHIVFVGLIIIIAMIGSVPNLVQTQRNNQQALAPIVARDTLIADVLKHRPAKTLIGDYWRVMPIRQRGGNVQTVLPLQDCTQPRNVLSSKFWEAGATTQPFAYLLTYDKGLTDFPACSLDDVTKAFGQPSSSVLISGSAIAPQEQLLFFEASRKPSTMTNAATPINLKDVSSPECLAGTVMQVVAHQDDDILFMNPQLSRDLAAGKCVQTIFVTDGNGGNDLAYALGRQLGAQAAYDKMLGKVSVWRESLVKMPGGSVVTIAQPIDNSRVSLVYLNLPDGGLEGTGFANHGFQSLSKLETGTTQSLRSSNTGSNYTAAQLHETLVNLLGYFQPMQVRTLSNYEGNTYKDHSDHTAVARLTLGAYESYRLQYNNRMSQVINYQGYSVRDQAANISNVEASDKLAIFLAYAKHDGAVCQNTVACLHSDTYGEYLLRQYTIDY